jgi:hypothetical protein
MNMMMSLLLCLSRAAQIAKQQRSIGEQNGHVISNGASTEKENLAECKKKANKKRNKY